MGGSTCEEKSPSGSAEGGQREKTHGNGVCTPASRTRYDKLRHLRAIRSYPRYERRTGAGRHGPASRHGGAQLAAGEPRIRRVTQFALWLPPKPRGDFLPTWHCRNVAMVSSHVG